MARAAHIVARAPRVEWHARRAHIGVLTFGFEQHGRPSVLSLPAQAELLTLNHEQHLNYEFSHILMFSTAIVYAKVRILNLTLNLTRALTLTPTPTLTPTLSLALTLA